MRAFPLWFLRSRLSIANYLGLPLLLRLTLRDGRLQAKANEKARALLPEEFSD